MDETGPQGGDAGSAQTPGDADGAVRTAGERIVLRPRLVRTVGLGVGAVVLVGMSVLALVIPHFTVVSRAGFIVLGLLIFWFCYREATVRVIAEPDRLTVRNLFTTTQLEWAQVIGVSFPQGDPWAHLDLADGDTLATMALQRSDGAEGISAARELARLVRERGEAQDLTS